MKKKYILGIGLGAFILLSTTALLYFFPFNKTPQNVTPHESQKLLSADTLIDKALANVKGKYIDHIEKDKIAKIYDGVTAFDMPHTFIEKIPTKFDVKTEDDKTLFMKIMTPHLLRTNEKIMNERRALFVLNEKMKAKQPFSEKENSFFNMLSQKYDVMHLNAETSRMAELITRVDIIPVSLGVAISIWATNWGQENKTSPFMEYAWNEKVEYTPIQFKSLSNATDSFALQLNTRSQLASFRTDRQMYRFFDTTQSFGWNSILNMSNYLNFIPTFMDQLKLIYPLGYINELDNACFKEGCALAR